jgi:hypothetical protein
VPPPNPLCSVLHHCVGPSKHGSKFPNLWDKIHPSCIKLFLSGILVTGE